MVVDWQDRRKGCRNLSQESLKSSMPHTEKEEANQRGKKI